MDDEIGERDGIEDVDFAVTAADAFLAVAAAGAVVSFAAAVVR